MTEPGDGSARVRYFLDENIGRSITRFLRETGREAIESRDVAGPQAADRVIEWIAATEEFVLVSHDKHFKGIVSGVSRSRLRRGALVVWLNVRETRAVERLQQCITLIEDQIAYASLHNLRIELIHVQENHVIVRYELRRPDEVDPVEEESPT